MPLSYDLDEREFTEFTRRVAGDESEESLHQMLAEHPDILISTRATQGGHFPVQLSKFRLAGDYVPDFVLIAHRSFWSWDVEFVEIEPSAKAGKLFNNSGEPTGRLRGALTQVENWATWMTEYGQSIFVPKVIEKLSELGAWDSRPEFYQRSSGNRQDMMVWYRVIIGRRADWSDHAGFRQRRRIEVPTRLNVSHWDDLVDARRPPHTRS